MAARDFRRIVIEVEPELEDRLRHFAALTARTKKDIIVAALTAYLNRQTAQKEE